MEKIEKPEKIFLAKEEALFLEEQEKLRHLVEIPPEGAGYVPSPGDIILALDIQYEGDRAHVGGDLWRWEGAHIDTFGAVVEAKVPYVPSFFCFREGPPLLSFCKKLEEAHLSKPHLIIVDGHGIAHPRKFGVACWLGLALKTPCIGCAKDTLVHYEGEIAPQKGGTLAIGVDGETVGFVLRYQDNVRPVFVSPGHLVSLSTAREVVLALPGEYRVPDPLRRADQCARNHAKGTQDFPWKDLGKIDSIKPFWQSEKEGSSGNTTGV